MRCEPDLCQPFVDSLCFQHGAPGLDLQCCTIDDDTTGPHWLHPALAYCSKPATQDHFAGSSAPSSLLTCIPSLQCPFLAAVSSMIAGSALPLRRQPRLWLLLPRCPARPSAQCCVIDGSDHRASLAPLNIDIMSSWQCRSAPLAAVAAQQTVPSQR